MQKGYSVASDAAWLQQAWLYGAEVEDGEVEEAAPGDGLEGMGRPRPAVVATLSRRTVAVVGRTHLKPAWRHTYTECHTSNTTITVFTQGIY